MAYYIISSSLLISAISVIGIMGAAVNERYLRRGIVVLVSLSLGALLGDAFIHLIPEALEEAGNSKLVSLLVIFGILLSFVIEKILGWHHGHGHDNMSPEVCIEESNAGKFAVRPTSGILPLGRMILFSDGIHNFMDGIIIGASFLVSFEVGIASVLAIAFHEIPQEIGDFGLLLYAGYEKKRALWLNFLSALSVVFGAIAFIIFGEALELGVPYILPFAAGSFIYIAASDLIPELHKRRGFGSLVVQLIFAALGVAVMYALQFVE